MDKTNTTSVRLIQDMPAAMVAKLHEHRLFRCGVAMPNCVAPPAGELRTGKLCRLFCREHLEKYCRLNGVEPPAPTEAGRN